MISAGDPGSEYVLVENDTIECPWGWVFFWQSRTFVETGNPSSMLAGNTPIAINRVDGSAARFPTSVSVEQSIARACG
jgi:hypothetical protein